MWIERISDEPAVVWDPERAHAAFLRVRLGIMADQLRATATKMPDSDMVQRGVKVIGQDGNEGVIPIEEHILRMEGEAEEAKLELWRAGGIMAVEAYVHGRQGISYAGEVPKPHQNTTIFTGEPGRIRL